MTLMYSWRLQIPDIFATRFPVSEQSSNKYLVLGAVPKLCTEFSSPSECYLGLPFTTMV